MSSFTTAAQTIKHVYKDVSSGFSPWSDNYKNGECLQVESPLSIATHGCDGDMLFAVRMRSLKSSNDRGYTLMAVSDSEDTLSLHVTPNITDDPLRDVEKVRMTLALSGKNVAHVELDRGEFDCRSGWNILRLDRIGNDISVSAGRQSSRQVIYVSFVSERFSGNICNIIIIPDSNNILEIESAQLTTQQSARRCLNSGCDVAELYSLVENTGGIFGYWRLVDYDFDDRYMRPTDNLQMLLVPLSYIPEYKLLPISSTLPDATDVLVFVYADGDASHLGVWESGMIKALLIPSGTAGVWQLRWYDSEGNEIDSESLSAKPLASLTSDGDAINLVFPSRYSSFRFAKQRK